MNCKPGDLAVIVGAKEAPQNNGRIVEVVRAFPIGEVWGNNMKRGPAPAWIVRSTGTPLVMKTENVLTGRTWFRLVQERPYSDRCLRPIRDHGDDATDEMVLLVGMPGEVTA